MPQSNPALDAFLQRRAQIDAAEAAARSQETYLSAQMAMQQQAQAASAAQAKAAQEAELGRMQELFNLQQSAEQRQHTRGRREKGEEFLLQGLVKPAQTVPVEDLMGIPGMNWNVPAPGKQALDFGGMFFQPTTVEERAGRDAELAAKTESIKRRSQISALTEDLKKAVDQGVINRVDADEALGRIITGQRPEESMYGIVDRQVQNIVNERDPAKLQQHMKRLQLFMGTIGKIFGERAQSGAGVLNYAKDLAQNAFNAKVATALAQLGINPTNADPMAVNKVIADLFSKTPNASALIDPLETLRQVTGIKEARGANDLEAFIRGLKTLSEENARQGRGSIVPKNTETQTGSPRR